MKRVFIRKQDERSWPWFADDTGLVHTMTAQHHSLFLHPLFLYSFLLIALFIEINVFTTPPRSTRDPVKRCQVCPKRPLTSLRPCFYSLAPNIHPIDMRSHQHVLSSPE